MAGAALNTLDICSVSPTSLSANPSTVDRNVLGPQADAGFQSLETSPDYRVMSPSAVKAASMVNAPVCRQYKALPNASTAGVLRGELPMNPRHGMKLPRTFQAARSTTAGCVYTITVNYVLGMARYSRVISLPGRASQRTHFVRIVTSSARPPACAGS